MLRRGWRLSRVVAVVLASAGSASFATPPRSPISVALEVRGLDWGVSSGELVVLVSSVQDAPGTEVVLALPDGLKAERSEWTLDLLADVPVRLTTKWTLTAEPGNYTVSVRASRVLGPGSSWGDMASVPYHVEATGRPGARWRVDRVPVAKPALPRNLGVTSEAPLPFAFGDLSETSGAKENWPAAEALPPLPPDQAAVLASGDIAPDASGWTALGPAGTVTLVGTWQYPDRSGVPRAVDQQYLEIRHGDGTALSPRVFCFTQTNGSFSCSFPHPGTTMRVWLRSATNLTPGPTRLGVFSGIEIPGGCGSDSIDCTYANSSPSIACPDGGTCSLGVMVAAGGEPWIGAHQMTQDLVRSWKKILFDTKLPVSSHGGPARITYPTPTGVGPHAHVFDEGSETTGDPWLCIPAPFQTAADVVAHEYGHAVMDNLWYGFTPDWAQDDCPPTHYLSYMSGPGCALSEGFADFWSWYSNEFYDGDDDPANDGPVYDDPGFSSNFETRDDGAYWPGDTVEGNVAGAFGDMMDAANEGPPVCVGAADRMSDGIANIWQVLYAESSSTYADWFATYWWVYGHPLAPALEASSLNRIDYGFIANPTCAGALAMTGLSSSDTADTSLDTCPDPTAPTPVCGNGSNGKAVFYRWTAPAAGFVTVDTVGSAYDTILSAWTGDCTALSARGCNDDAVGTQSRLVVQVAQGETFTFMVSAYHDDGGSMAFHLDFAPHGAANDACGAATVITLTPYTDVEDVAAATNAANDPAHACAATATTRSVFYTWTAPADGMVHADTFGSTYDTVLSAYTGSCGALVPLACSDDAEDHGFASEIALAVTTGTTITFMVSDVLGTNDPILFFHLDFSTPPPPHDGCSAAKVVAATPYGDASNTYGASVAPGDPAPPCGGLSSGKSVWYEYTPPADGTVTVDTLGSAYDTVLSAWTGSCGMLAAVPGGCNDDYPPGATSVLQIPVSGGLTYRFMVSAYYDDGGVTAFHLNFAANPPANDGCDGANVVSGYPYQDAAYTAAASVEAGEPPSPCGNGSAERSVWYRFTAPATGELTLDTFGSAYNTILTAWSGPCGALAAEGCNDDGPGSVQSLLTLAVTRGRTYRIRVSSYDGDGGALAFGLQFAPAAGHVPDGSGDPLQALTVSKLPSGELMLSWAPSCLATDTDHAVYEGTLGSYYSHTPALCSTGGATSAVLRAPVHDAYYIVAPRNAAREGSHGFSDFGVERPAGPLTCLPRAVAACPPACTHDICVAGGPLDPACSDCVAGICAQIPECCASGWSTDCADWAQRSCAPECD